MRKSESIKFIFEDGELELTYAEVRNLKSDMLDTMLNSEVGVSDVIEIDVEKSTFVALMNVESSRIEVTTDMILLANYLQMTSIMSKLYRWHIFVTGVSEKLNIVSRVHAIVETKRVMTQRLNPNADLNVVMIANQGIANQGIVKIDVLFDDRHILIDWIFAGLDYRVAENMTKQHFRPNRLRDMVCGDPRCTNELFAQIFTPVAQEVKMLDDYVQRGLLSSQLADKLRKLSRSELSMAQLQVTQIGPLNGILQAPTFDKSEPFVPHIFAREVQSGMSIEQVREQYWELMRQQREAVKQWREARQLKIQQGARGEAERRAKIKRYVTDFFEENPQSTFVEMSYERTKEFIWRYLREHWEFSDWCDEDDMRDMILDAIHEIGG